MNRTQKDAIYLCACAVSGRRADPSRIREMNLGLVYETCVFHKITGAVAAALSAAGVEDPRFLEASAASIRRAFLFQKAWETIKGKLETAGIWYMPVKGAVLKDYYPRYGMRDMTDYDILVDSSRTAQIKDIMEELGYQFLSYDEYNHDIYVRPPVLNFEMHRALFADYDGENLYQYYRQIKDKLIRKQGYEYSLSPEDEYIYLIAHDYKHYYHEGMGLRPLLDLCLYLNKESLDFDYIARETAKMEIDGFERRIRSLSLHLMEETELSGEEEECLEYILSSGHFGTYDHQVGNQIQRKRFGKAQYMLSRFLVPVSPKNREYDGFVKTYPVFYRHKLLLPLLPFYRLIRSAASGRLMREARAIKKSRKETDESGRSCDLSCRLRGSQLESEAGCHRDSQPG